LPLIETKATYLRKWTEYLNSEIGFLYNSNRFADKDNKNEINSYLNLYFKSNYQILNNLKIYLELDNLTNNNNILWGGYRERGIYGSFGLNWLF
jgi:outer membrane cobalamin receptor